MKVRLLESKDKPAWDAFVHSHEGGTFCHQAGWQDIVTQGGGHEAPYLLAEQDGDIVGILPLSLQRSILFGKSLKSTSFAVYGGPLVSETSALEALDAAAWGMAVKAGVDALEYRCEKPLHDDWAVKDDLYVTFKKEITSDREANLLSIKGSQRRYIKKGANLGLTASVEDDLDLFYHLYAVSVRNLGTPIFPKALFAQYLDTFKGNADILVARTADGHPISAILSFYYKDQVLPYYIGSTPEARECFGNDFLIFEVLDHAAQRGKRLFDFGRSKVGTGAYAFKKHWGFDPAPLYYEYKLRDGAEIPDMNPLNPKYQLMIKTWKMLPVCLTKLIGPPIARHLG